MHAYWSTSIHAIAYFVLKFCHFYEYETDVIFIISDALDLTKISEAQFYFHKKLTTLKADLFSITHSSYLLIFFFFFYEFLVTFVSCL